MGLVGLAGAPAAKGRETEPMKLTPWILLIILLVATPAAWAAEGPVVAMGRAAVAGNELKARDLAVEDALRQAVGQSAAKLLDPATLRAGLQVLDQKVLAKAKQYVGSFTLEASSISDGQMLVLVSANVDARALEQALALAGIRVPTGNLGRVLVLVAEENAPGRPPVFWWSGYGQDDCAPRVVAKTLKAMGLELADCAPLRQGLPPELKALEITDEQALQLARLAGADIVLRGAARTYPLVSRPGQAETPLLDVQAIEAASGRVLAKQSAPGPKFSQTPGVEGAEQNDAALAQAVRDLVAQVVVARPMSAQDQGVLEIELSGVGSLGQLMRFEQVVSSLTSMVDSLRRQSLGGGKAVYRVEARVSASRLADEILVQNYGGFLVNVLEVAPGRLRLALLANH